MDLDQKKLWGKLRFELMQKTDATLNFDDASEAKNLAGDDLGVNWYGGEIDYWFAD